MTTAQPTVLYVGNPEKLHALIIKLKEKAVLTSLEQFILQDCILRLQVITNNTFYPFVD